MRSPSSYFAQDPGTGSQHACPPGGCPSARAWSTGRSLLCCSFLLQHREPAGQAMTGEAPGSWRGGSSRTQASHPLEQVPSSQTPLILPGASLYPLRPSPPAALGPGAAASPGVGTCVCLSPYPN
uniref:Uncharacterized protein n=1 Tax=Nothoprocta perdicaria TaxID=30464 RepID=A0A8C6ZHQ8_NOTPE